jgi:hypothetical protein
MIVRHVLQDRPAEMPLAKRHHSLQTLALDREHKSLRKGIQIRTPCRQTHYLHAASLYDPPKRPGAERITVHEQIPLPYEEAIDRVDQIDAVVAQNPLDSAATDLVAKVLQSPLDPRVAPPRSPAPSSPPTPRSRRASGAALVPVSCCHRTSSPPVHGTSAESFPASRWLTQHGESAMLSNCQPQLLFAEPLALNAVLGH